MRPIGAENELRVIESTMRTEETKLEIVESSATAELLLLKLLDLLLLPISSVQCNSLIRVNMAT